MKQYLALLQDILDNGTQKEDRTGTGTLSVFGRQIRFNLQEGFPLVTTKKTHLRSIIHELLWFLKGDTNTKYLEDNNVSIWQEWQSEDGDLGPVYGKQWREWSDVKIVGMWDTASQDTLMQRGYRRVGDITHDNPSLSKRVFQKEHDQISTVMNQLRQSPDSRRIIVSAWNVGDLADMALEPCHSFFQFYTRELGWYERCKLAYTMDGVPEEEREYPVNRPHDIESFHAKLDEFGVPRRALSCQLYQRSADTFLGVPFNIASYALLVEMMAQQLNMMPDEFVWTGGDVHLYSNHMEQVNLQLTREPMPLPRMRIKRKPDTIFGYQFDDFELVGYESHPAIKAPVAI